MQFIIEEGSVSDYAACEKACVRWNAKSKRCPKGAVSPKNNALTCNLLVRKG